MPKVKDSMRAKRAPKAAKQHFLLYAEWFEDSTQSGPLSQATGTMVRVGNNEVIDAPLTDYLFRVRAEGNRPGIVIRWAIPITLEEYERTVKKTKLLGEQK